MTRVIRLPDVQEWLGVQAAKYDRQSLACREQARRHRHKLDVHAAARWTAREMVLAEVARDMRAAIADVENLVSGPHQS